MSENVTPSPPLSSDDDEASKVITGMLAIGCVVLFAIGCCGAMVTGFVLLIINVRW